MMDILLKMDITKSFVYNNTTPTITTTTTKPDSMSSSSSSGIGSSMSDSDSKSPVGIDETVSSHVQPTQTSNKKNFGLCRVCKDKATGIHYGIRSCEGCKVS